MNEIYEALYQYLVSQLSANVYGHVPQDLANNKYPFVRLDPIQSTNNDTLTENGFTATIQLVSFSRFRGVKEISNIADEVYNALQNYDMPDTATYGISGIFESFRTIKTQPDGLTRNAVQQYVIIFEPLPL